MKTSIYEQKPWLKSYPQDIPANIEIPIQSVNDAFDKATEFWKNRIALNFYGKKISFFELRNKVDKFATALYDLGIRKGDRVALLLLNSPEYFIAFYGLLQLILLRNCIKEMGTATMVLVILSMDWP